MSPHTMLSNMATVSGDASQQSTVVAPRSRDSDVRDSSTPLTFSSYIETLVNRVRIKSYPGLLSPTDTDLGTVAQMAESSSTMKELIDAAVSRSFAVSASKRSPKRYEITRGGYRLAVIILARSACKLGETVPVIIDFQNSDIPCYSLNATLETSEAIDPAIAIRSKASILRVTRRIHACQFEPTISARKISFRPIVPLSSTPEFITSGINLQWTLRFEFVTDRFDEAKNIISGLDDLMEEVARDDRGTVRAALQDLPCETFDVNVPLRVYGAAAAFDDNIEVLSHPI